jgi:capping protein beta
MASDSAAVDAALQLMRRLPPEAVVANLGTLLGARPDLTEELLSRVDQPLQVATDEVSGRDFLLCDYNRDADSYRCARCHVLPQRGLCVWRAWRGR